LPSTGKARQRRQFGNDAGPQWPFGKLGPVGDNRTDEIPVSPRRFPPEVISHAVSLYRRFTLSFRDVEDLLAERGVSVSYEAIRSW